MILSNRVAVVLVLVVLLCSVEGWWWRRRGRRGRRGRWTTSVNANVGNTGVPSVSGSATYKKNNWEVKGTGSVDMNGNWRAGVGATWRFKKRDMQPPEIFHLKVELSPCQFAIYDSDGDGLVTLEEFNNVYNDYLANNLMKALDEDHDGAVTFEEFWAAPKIIEGLGCDPNLPPVDVPLDDDDVDDDDVANDVIDDEEVNANQLNE